MQLLDEIINVLKKDERLVSDDKLLKNRIVELALKLDKDLIKLLLNNKRIKEHFFEEIDKTLVFDKEKFMKFVDNKEFLPDSYTSFKNKIGLTADRKYLSKSKEVVLSWPYKDCILEGGQEKEDEKRKEIFHNEILAPDEIDRLLEPKVFTNFKKIDAKGEHKVTDVKVDDNLIIKGNNLLVLHSLKKRFAGKVKLIYIDPPFNTGNGEFRYNDSFRHSTWLTFMKNRLKIAKDLLKDEGAIFIQVDDIEVGYLQVLADEIFDRENFLSEIAYQRSGSAGLGQGGAFLINTTEFILVYAKDKSKLQTFEVKSSEPLDYEVMKRYKHILVSLGKKELIHKFKAASTKEIVRIYKHSNFKVESISLAKFEEKKDEIRKAFLNNFDKIFRTTNPQAENKFQQELISKMSKGLFSAEYTASRGKHEGQRIIRYYYDKGIFAWLKDTARVENNDVIKETKISDFWAHKEIPKADLANEGGVKLKRGKKPEQLMKRILELVTKEGDLVLDYHLGCGTTTAVAHKMKRHYIGVEQLDYRDDDSVVRLKNVIGKSNSKGKLKESIDDYDSTGISKSVNWKGGGSFIYCELKELNEEFVQKIKKAKDSKELLKVWEEMKKHAFLSYRINEKLFDENIEEFKVLSVEDQKKLLVKCLDVNNLYINYSEMEDSQYNVSKENKDINKKFYGGL